MYYKKKLQYLIQLKNVTTLINKASKINGSGLDIKKNLKIIKDTQQNVKYIKSHSKMLEQQIAGILGCLSRTTISDEIPQIKLEGDIKEQVMTKLQFVLTNIWSVAA